MKKKIFVIVSIIILVSVCFFNVLFALDPDPSEDGGGIGGGGGQTWWKEKKDCSDKIRQKILCTAGGWDQCEATYCN